MKEEQDDETSDRDTMGGPITDQPAGASEGAPSEQRAQQARCSVAPGSAFVISARALYWATQYREACLAADMAGAHYPKLQDFIQRALDEQASEPEPISREEVDAYLGVHVGVNLDDIMAQHIREGYSPCS